ncbi:unnamed protein product [Strongylus vulgaris]|uniref:Uncharacterized protein n=1 Tax=Strongylus vulgaris TaxID=40348 RepID=A0A3P7J609_STRVU|nr:unnamed protein product [Strongylus vulgaris]
MDMHRLERTIFSGAKNTGWYKQQHAFKFYRSALRFGTLTIALFDITPQGRIITTLVAAPATETLPKDPRTNCDQNNIETRVGMFYVLRIPLKDQLNEAAAVPFFCERHCSARRYV